MRLLLTSYLLYSLISPTSATADDGLLAKDNLVAWCIVPFDASKRGPEERAVMLKVLGLKKCAYDWRPEHVPTFEEEILAYKKHGIEFFAFWSVHEEAFKLFEKHQIHPQIWTMIPGPKGPSQAEKITQAVASLKPLAERTKQIDCPLSLYNHGGWQGEPANMVAVCQELRDAGYDHVGIVYNFHHGHEHIEDWPKLFKLMQPYLHCLNINGMNDNAQPKILKLGDGNHELEMLRVVQESGYDGPIGILDHQGNRDSKEVLAENLEGVEKLTPMLKAKQSKTSSAKKKRP
ncbi:MAG: hypothetical protein P8M30_17040 [Planctomycetaceae bacterium]|nr:hypothetical protein [Planctomycetaceae bacterium]